MNKTSLISWAALTSLAVTYSACGQMFQFQHELTAPDALSQQDAQTTHEFGRYVDVANGQVIIGARNDFEIAVQAGAAYLFDGLTGEFRRKLLPERAQGFPALDRFGGAVAISEDRILIGAPFQDVDDVPATGGAHLYNQDGSSRLQSWAAPGTFLEDKWFGNSVAMDRQTVVAGAYADGLDVGFARAYDPDSGNLRFELRPPTDDPFQWFGWDVAVDQNLIAVGTPHQQRLFNQGGSVYLYDSFTGAPIDRLQAGVPQQDDLFGFSVAMTDRHIVVGAFGDERLGEATGAVYIFDRETRQQLHKLIAPDGAAFDVFGRTVDADGSLVVIGAFGDDDMGRDAGAAYVFNLETGDLVQKLLAPDGQDGDIFGIDVAIDGDLIAIGSIFDDAAALDGGSVYIFTAVPEPSAAMLLMAGIFLGRLRCR